MSNEDDQYNYEYNLEELNRDLKDSELKDLTDPQLASLYQDLQKGSGSNDMYDLTMREICRRCQLPHPTSLIG